MKKEDIAGTGNFISKGVVRHSLTTRYPLGEHFVFTQNATFMNEHGDSFEEAMKISYDGKVAKHFQMGGLPLNDTPRREILSGAISQNKHFLEQWAINVSPIGFSVFRFAYDAEKVPLSEGLKYNNGALARIDKSINKVNDFNTVRVDLLQEYTKQVVRRIYFSVDHGYAPVRFEYLNGPNVAGTVDVNSLEEVKKGLWFPSRGVIKGTPEERMNIYRATSKIIVNQSLKDEVFDIGAFPAGTRVEDEITGKTYTVKPTQEQVNQSLPAK
jgi:hypothetical protein